jgi:hypothetical protein
MLAQAIAKVRCKKPDDADYHFDHVKSTNFKVTGMVVRGLTILKTGVIFHIDVLGNHKSDRETNHDAVQYIESENFDELNPESSSEG